MEQDAIYKVSLVDEQNVVYEGVHVTKDEAALAALSMATQYMGQHHWEDGTIGAMPLLKTFTGYDDVALYWEDVSGGGIKFEVKYLGPYDRGELDVEDVGSTAWIQNNHDGSVA